MTTWAELVRLMGQAHVRTARGVWRGVAEVDEETGPSVTAETAPLLEVQRFVFESPDRWRVSTSDGDVLRMSDGERMLLWQARDEPTVESTVAGTATHFVPDPLAMMGRR